MWDSRTSTNLSFLLHNFIERRFFFTVDVSHLSIQYFFFTYEVEIFTFLLEECTLCILFHFMTSLANPNFSHHYTCTTGSLLSKSHLNKNCLMKTADQITTLATKWQRGREHSIEKLDKGVFHITGRKAWYFIMLLGIAHNLKLTNFLFTSGNSHLVVSECSWQWVTETEERGTEDKVEETMYTWFQPLDNLERAKLWRQWEFSDGGKDVREDEQAEHRAVFRGVKLFSVLI